MRILHVLNHVPDLGDGIVNVAVDLACIQRHSGHDVAVASVGGALEALLATHDVEILRLDQRRRPGALLRATGRLRAVLRSWKPDVVHVHHMTGILLARVARVGLPVGIVSTVHNEFQRSSILMGMADRVIAVSAAVKQRLVLRGIPAARIDVVHNGTLGSPRRRFAATRSDLRLKRPSVMTVAGMNRRKGIPDLLAAFDSVAARHAAATLYLVGDGPDRAEFEAAARQLRHADRIVFTGFQSDVSAYLDQADIFVLASHRDPFPLVISEAREAGAAMIATSVDGIPEALEHGASGILVPPGDPDALAKQIEHLLDSPEALALWKGRARQNLAWLHVARMAEETVAVYGKLGRPRGPAAMPAAASDPPQPQAGRGGAAALRHRAGVDSE